jgi:hypothetical protein
LGLPHSLLLASPGQHQKLENLSVRDLNLQTTNILFEFQIMLSSNKYKHIPHTAFKFQIPGFTPRISCRLKIRLEIRFLFHNYLTILM